MTAAAEPLLSWLRRMRRTNVVQEILWIHHFDLDGAVAAGQLELAWRARSNLIVFGVELALHGRGVYPPGAADYVEEALVVLRCLAGADPALAAEAWDLLLRPAPADEEGLRREIAAARHFLEHRLAVPAALSRDEAIRAWADGLKLLRDVGRDLGIGGSDDWYLPEDGPAGEQIGWYDEVIRTIDRHRAAPA
ncbi:hypothetical protein [Virgisporangium aurantiacum]|uniref:Uncharacterized protein n=1 Tax=Virgisporangium aurantiacum TaxID=175570 RepID=A0A8J3ZG79_9ACTN|nr:hypothetical protein [Virgisporangium aurantiacum]GIJ62223.1 hypothetical protein Vau01_097390 [Virgisporangium aurantiacum]